MLKIRNLDKAFYPGTPDENVIFKDFNLDIEENISTAILGPNGCGKSTLFNLISGSLSADKGKIYFDDLELGSLPEEKRSRYIGKVNQDPSRGVSPNLNILENISISLLKGDPFTFKRLVKKEEIDFIVSKLKELDLGLENKLNTEVKFLSGGQRQSLSLLMATLKTPRLLLLDEHTAALDPKTSKLMMEKSRELIKKDNITTMMITHNLRNAINYSDKILMLNKGQVVLNIDSKDITEEELIHIYTSKIEDDFAPIV